MKHFLTSYSPTRVLRLLSVAALIAGMVFGAGPAPAVRADATLTVNSTADLTDLVPGNGVCDADPGPATVCTLRAAIQESNGMAGNDTIIVPSGIYTLTIAGFSEEFSATGDFDLRDNVIISGAGAATTIIDGGGLDRVFDLGDAFLTTVISATLSNMTIQNGLSTSDGGGVVNAGQVLTVTNSAIINNTAPGDGGGLANISASGVTIITNSTVSGNSSSADGGGFSNSGVMTVTNSTISGNTANLNGGGIRNISTLALINVTIASNSGGSGGGFGGGLYNTLGTATLTNSLIADSTLGADCANSGTLVNGGNNIVKDDSCLPGGGDPNLGPLQDNGGPTKTHALLSPSTAIDGGNNANCPSADQRGIARPQGPTCDVGAFEAEYNDAPVNGVPGSQTMDEDTTQVFSSGGGNALSVSDVDAGSNAVQTTLTGTNGVMTLAGTSGLTFSVGDGTADATMTFTGTVSAITAALNGLSFAPPANYYGAASVQITTNDLGNTGLGGAQSDSDTVAITVTAVNDSPTLNSISDPAAINEDAGLQTINLAGIGSGAANETQTLTVTAVSGNSSLIPNPAVSYTSPGATGSLSYTPVPNANGTTTITVTVMDSGGVANGGVDTLSRTFNVVVNEVNDAPVNGVPGSQTMDEDTTQVFSSGGGNALSVSDVDAGSNAVQTTLTGTNGVMTLAGTSGLTFSVGDGTADATMTFTGTVSAITAALNGLSFAPPANYYGAASVQITTNDLGNTGLGGAQSDSDTVAITVTAVNDSPTISDIANQSTDAGVPTSAVAFTIGDVETPASSLTITGTSSNLALVPNANIVFGGAAANRTVTVTPLPGQAGTTTITVTVSDGTDTATDTFVLTVVFRLFLPIVLRP